MNVVISHQTAFAFLDQSFRLVPDPEYRFLLKDYPGGFPDSFAKSSSELRRFAFERFEAGDRPIDILVPSAKHFRDVKGFRFHAPGGEIPEGMLVDAGLGILVCEGPLLYLQLCQHETLERCIKIGSNLCGLYSLEPTNPDGVVGRKQITTTKTIEESLELMKPLVGSRNAAAAFPWVIDRARSPKEAELAMALYLPKRLGGLGFEKPKLNVSVPLEGEATRIEDDPTNEIDVYWEDPKVGLEYQSYADHGDPRKIGEDRRRQLALEAMGVHVEMVTQKQLADPRQLRVIARILDERGVPRVS